jgi:S1-C subfamily serine protease
MGNAEGAGGTPSAVPGNVTALNQTVSASDVLTGSSETLNGLIAASAGIRPGDSGGPMVNSAGQVIGMNTAASGNYQMAQPGGQGFAIPINQARSIAGQITAGGASGTVHIGPTAFIGVGVADTTGGAPGPVVKMVVPDTPAAQLGLANNDVIVSLNGAPINSATALTNMLDQHHPGDNVQLAWHKPNEPVHTGNVTLGAGPPG